MNRVATILFCLTLQAVLTPHALRAEDEGAVPGRSAAPTIRAPTPPASPVPVRSIRKEPGYTGVPGYSLLLLGAEPAKRIWMIVDANTLYFDRNGDGDLTGAGERIAGSELDGTRTFAVGDFPTMNAKPADFEVTCYAGRVYLRMAYRGSAIVQSASAALAASAKDADIIHMNGPLTLHTPNTTIPRNETTKFQVQVGEYGVGDMTFASLEHDRIPAELHPVAEFEFPAKTPGAAPIRQRIELKGRCCGDKFHAPVHVPAEAGEGRATVRLSFDSMTATGWTVTGATIELPLEP